MLAARAVVEGAVHGATEHTYGVNTGFGRFVSKSIPEELTRELQLRLLRSHACGVGDPYPEEIVRAAMLLRANALAKGRSGARPEVVELLLECMNRGVLPYVPSRGSVGASGDLAPLAHLALPLVGEGEATFEGRAARRAGGARARRARTGDPRGQGGPLARERNSVHGRIRSARADARAAVGEGGRHRLLSFAGGAPGLALELPAPGARVAPAARAAELGSERAVADRGLGNQRVSSLVRQGAGRLLAPVRAAGARRVPRPARLRRLHGLGRAERGHRQPPRARRGRPPGLERQLPRPARRVRARRAGHGGGRVREHLRAPRRTARQPEPVGRPARRS